MPPPNPPPNPDPQLAHPEAAGWVLGTLDPGDADQFAAHLHSCPGCQAAVAELQPTARMLHTAAPAALPPPDLQARTLASVRQAAAQETAGQEAAVQEAVAHARPVPAPARRAWWRTWNRRMLALAAAVVVAAGVGIGVLVSRPGGLSFTIPLHPAAGQAASGQALAHQADGGWSIQLSVHHLRALGPGQFYECWYASPGNRPGHPQLITAGTFTVPSSGTATVHMWSAADPRTFPTMQITAQTPGDGSQHGQTILTGTGTATS